MWSAIRSLYTHRMTAYLLQVTRFALRGLPTRESLVCKTHLEVHVLFIQVFLLVGVLVLLVFFVHLVTRTRVRQRAYGGNTGGVRTKADV